MADKAMPAARFDGHAAVGGAGGDGHLLGDVAFVRNAEIHQFGCKKQGRD